MDYILNISSYRFDVKDFLIAEIPLTRSCVRSLLNAGAYFDLRLPAANHIYIILIQITLRVLERAHITLIRHAHHRLEAFLFQISPEFILRQTAVIDGIHVHRNHSCAGNPL